MKSPISVVLFDLGSTLIYDKEPWQPFFLRADAALWDNLHSAGVQLTPRALYGGFDTLFQFYYSNHRGDLNEPTTFTVLDGLLRENGYALSAETLRGAMRTMYAVTQSNWFPEAEAIPTLQALVRRGFRIGLISNAADDENTQVLIDKGGFRPYLDYIISSAAFGRRKPDPGIFRDALDYFGVPAARAVMIGDTPEADILGGQQAGMNTIWITRRVHDAVEGRRPRPDTVVARLDEIPALLSA